MGLPRLRLAVAPVMTERLEQAFAEAARLPEAEQDALAEWLLDELASDERWQRAFSGSQDRLADLAREALAERRGGRTRPLASTLTDM